MPDNNCDSHSERDLVEAALLGLTEAVNRNSEAIAENTRMLQAIIKHLKAPYEKPPMGFQKEARPDPDLPVQAV